MCPHSFLNDSILSDNKSSLFWKGFKKILYKYETSSLWINEQPKRVSKKSECILFHSPASISWFKTTALNSYKGTEPIFTLRSCVLGVRRASSSGQSEEHCHADRHTMQSEPVSNKETKRTFAGNARYRQILLLDLKCGDMKVGWLLGNTKRETTWKEPIQKNWEMERDKLTK